MSEAASAAEIVRALGEAASAPLISVEITWLTSGDVARVETRVVRKTRTLVFMSADGFSADGARVVSASSVHRVE